MLTPHFKHDPTCCVFLGTVLFNDCPNDLYACRQDGDLTFICRYGSLADQYRSMPESVVALNPHNSGGHSVARMLWHMQPDEVRNPPKPVKVTITKVFHRRTIAFEKGMSHVETMSFVNFDDAIDWARGVNENHANVDYHVTNVFLDMDNFYRAAVSHIWSEYQLAEDYLRLHPR